MRLRKRSGMEVCKIVLRNTAEITSDHPATASITRAIHSTWTSPKTAIAAPQASTARMTARPCRVM